MKSPKELRSKGYTMKVKYTSTNNFGCGPKGEDDVYTVEEFRTCVESQAFIDYDGVGHPVIGHWANPDIWIKPSQIDDIPKEATHIVWFNR